jgi:hypothetical protein
MTKLTTLSSKIPLHISIKVQTVATYSKETNAEQILPLWKNTKDKTPTKTFVFMKYITFLLYQACKTNTNASTYEITYQLKICSQNTLHYSFG